MTDGGRFPRAVRSEKAENFSFADVQAYVEYSSAESVIFGQPAHFDDVHTLLLAVFLLRFFRSALKKI